MTLSIGQDAAATDSLHWNWSVWLEGTGDELDAVKQVVWKLHPSFSPPEVKVRTRNNAFRLESSGWGEFEIHADVHLANGERISLRHGLRFSQTAPRKNRSKATVTGGAVGSGIALEGVTTIQGRQPKVFLSYTSGDARLARALTEELKRNHNIDVFVDVDIPAGENLRDWISEKITESDAAVFLLPEGDSASRSYSFTGFELGLAEKLGPKSSRYCAPMPTCRPPCSKSRRSASPAEVLPNSKRRTSRNPSRTSCASDWPGGTMHLPGPASALPATPRPRSRSAWLDWAAPAPRRWCARDRAPARTRRHRAHSSARHRPRASAAR